FRHRCSRRPAASIRFYRHFESSKRLVFSSRSIGFEMIFGMDPGVLQAWIVLGLAIIIASVFLLSVSGGQTENVEDCISSFADDILLDIFSRVDQFLSLLLSSKPTYLHLVFPSDP
ncbi:hypothetical protein PENTCL1PPCAC_3764, partial [Pristionchus entomophagus]